MPHLLRLLIPVALTLMVLPLASAAPYLPASSDEVLERLPERTDPSLRDVKRLRATLARTPNDLQLASRAARAAIDASRSTGDPRFLGMAQAALSPWWDLAEPPDAALLLRATIRQSNHDFDGALRDLDRLIAHNPADGQALLTRATVLAVQGRYREASADCTRMARLTLPLVVASCMAVPTSLSGDAAAAYDALTHGLAQTGNGDAGLREWALTLAAEVAERRGDYAAAEAHYRSALAIDIRDPYLLAAYCDYLLDRGRPAEVLPLVAGQLRNDNLLLRAALAEARLTDAHSAFVRDRADLADRFDAAHRRGDSLHKREEARYRLAIEKDAQGSLKLARENWAVQREPADLRILFEAASAVSDAAALREVADWRAAHRLEFAALGAPARNAT